MKMAVSSDQVGPSTFAPNDHDYVHTGPGTPAGRYLRRFWQPVACSHEIPAGRAKPVKIMEEELTLYRGEGGAAHVVAFRCPHRGTQLSTGWVEGDNIRCFYHGWKYDGTGQCIEQPAEDAAFAKDRKSTRLNSSHANISYAVFCLKKKKNKLIIYI